MMEPSKCIAFDEATCCRAAFACAVLWGGLLLCGPSRSIAEDPAGAYKAPSEEPSPVETLILEYINRCRANPPADAALIRQTKKLPASVDYKMFDREMQQALSAPPLVFDLALLKASRWHSWYQILHEQGHDEIASKPRFTGSTPPERMRRAGFKYSGTCENVFRTAKDPWYCHCAFIVDWGEGPGGMQPQRGHRRNILNSTMRLAGVGAVLHDNGGDFCITHDFGRCRERMAGGVIYNDRNRNRFYDLGEGIGSIALSVGSKSVKSWLSGAYAMSIPSEKTKIVVELGKTQYAVLLPGGDDNVKFDVLVSDAALFAQGGKLLRAAKKIPEDDRNKTRRFIALVDLYLATKDTLVEETALDEIIQLTNPVQRQIEQAMAEVRRAMAGGDFAEAKKVASTQSRTFSRTKARTWFAEAVACASMKESFERLKSLKDSGKPISRTVLKRALRAQQKKFLRLRIHEWKRYGMQIGKQTLDLGASRSQTK